MRYVLFRSLRGGKNWHVVDDLTIAGELVRDMSRAEVQQFMIELAPLTPDYIYEARSLNIPGITEGEVVHSKPRSKQDVSEWLQFQNRGVLD